MKKILALIPLIAATSFSYEFSDVGFRSVGMGGAGVANATGSVMAYYNPALLAFNRYDLEFSISVMARYRELNLIDRINKLNDYKFTEALEHVADNAPISGSNIASGDNIRVKNSLEEIKKISDKNGLNFTLFASTGIQIGHFAIGSYAMGDISAKAIIDKNHLDLIVEDNGNYYRYNPDSDTYVATTKEDYENHSIEYAIDKGLTYVKVKNVNLVEVPLSYGYKLLDNFSIGINLKYIKALTYKIENEIDDDNFDINNNKYESSTFGVDIGALYCNGPFRVGLVAKNLNAPNIKFYDGSKYKLNRMLRAGIAYDITSMLTFAFDADLTKNKTLLEDFDSQYIGGGIDFHQSWFSLRGGAKYNLADSGENEGVIFTAGLGFGLKWFQLDIAGEVASKKSTYDGNNIPRYAQVSLSLLSRWGG